MLCLKKMYIYIFAKTQKKSVFTGKNEGITIRPEVGALQRQGYTGGHCGYLTKMA